MKRKQCTMSGRVPMLKKRKSNMKKLKQRREGPR